MQEYDNKRDFNANFMTLDRSQLSRASLTIVPYMCFYLATIPWGHSSESDELGRWSFLFDIRLQESLRKFFATICGGGVDKSLVVW